MVTNLVRLGQPVKTSVLTDLVPLDLQSLSD